MLNKFGYPPTFFSLLPYLQQLLERFPSSIILLAILSTISIFLPQKS
jgi:hypothetical protein